MGWPGRQRSEHAYCSYATPGGHALLGARVHLAAKRLEDTDRSRRARCPTAPDSVDKPRQYDTIKCGLPY